MCKLSQKQKGNTCQYFSILYLMQEANAGVFCTNDFIDFISYIVNKSTNNSGFIIKYLTKPYTKEDSTNGNSTTYIKGINKMELNKLYYVDNTKHAVVILRTEKNKFKVWNPQLCKVIESNAKNNVIKTNGQSYSRTIDVWALKKDLPDSENTTTERNRQIKIVNDLSAYLSRNTKYTSRLSDISTPATYMKLEEKKAFVNALYSLYSTSKKVKPDLNKMKASLEIP